MAEPSKTDAPFGLRRNLDRGTAPRARPRPGRGAVWPSLRCRHRRHTSVWVFVAAARRYAPTSPAPPRLAYGPPALATRPFVLSPRTAKITPHAETARGDRQTDPVRRRFATAGHSIFGPAAGHG